jgi:hypothetical protein
MRPVISMNHRQEEILERIRERVLAKEQELRRSAEKETEIQTTLQALEEITQVPRSEMNRIAEEIRQSYAEPQPTTADPDEIPKARYKKLPATVRDALSRLPVLQRKAFWEEYQLSRRHIAIVYLLWLMPPPFSGHYLYLRNHLKQAFFFLSCGGLFLWWLVDLFRIPRLTEMENRKTARRILLKILRHHPLSTDRNPT